MRARFAGFSCSLVPSRKKITENLFPVAEDIFAKENFSAPAWTSAKLHCIGFASYCPLVAGVCHTIKALTAKAKMPLFSRHLVMCMGF